MKVREIDSALLFKALAGAEKRKIDKLVTKAKRKQRWINFKRRLGL